MSKKRKGQKSEPWVHPDILPAEIVKVTDPSGKVRVGYHVHDIEHRDGRIAAVWLASPRRSAAERYVASDRCRVEPLSEEEMGQLLEERRSAAQHHRPTPIDPIEGTDR
ncbi:hypothetical protein [Streptomyces melanosporofaciens]|uniref:Uncharacterized protein n=1 Tax=Streptomyces melanosporofaciens TaxID=67327 RepID=A0A1H4KQ03_STRMJ|nr:hypothetical protein [Streptomyces melanosporofaciens]SEB60175.1 hypothetical protein SAMN04490356_0871 [Streptomyces melanosporofaciens]